MQAELFWLISLRKENFIPLVTSTIMYIEQGFIKRYISR